MLDQTVSLDVVRSPRPTPIKSWSVTCDASSTVGLASSILVSRQNLKACI